MGGVLARLAAKKELKKGTKVIYTAHGFHFFKGSPLKNWVLYYPIEKYLAKFTDCLITINNEDYNTASSRNFKSKSIKQINGVGIDLTKFKHQSSEIKQQLRYDYGFSEDDFIMIFAGELSYRKHQDMLIRALSLLKKNIPNIKLLLVGTGKLLDDYKEQAVKCGVDDHVCFLGFRDDVAELMMLSDIAVSSSRQEGLPVNVMEAMAIGLPLVVTNCRGNRDLVINNENGFVVEIDDIEGLANGINKLYQTKELRSKFRKNNLNRIGRYSLEFVIDEMKNIYSSI